MIALDALTETWYTPTTDNESGTQFLLRPLSGYQSMRIVPMIELTEDQQGVILTPDAMRQLIEFGLVDWKGLVDTDGNEIKFTVGNIERLTLFALKDIAYEIFSRTQITVEAKKKS